MLKTRPQNKTSAVKSAADEIKEHTRIAKILYENHNDTRYNQTTGRFEDFLGNKVEPQEYIRDQKKLQKSVDSLSPHKDYYYDPSTQQFEHKDRPPPHVLNSEKQLKFGSAAHRRAYPEQYKTINELNDLKKFQNGTFKEPTIGTALHRKKYPERYGYKYTSKLDQAAYPKAGTAPSEQEIQKRLDRARGPSDWDLIKQTATRPEDKKQIRDIINKEYKRNGMLNISKDEVKYVDKSLIKPVKIFDNLDPTSFLSNATQRRAVLTPKKYTEPPQYPEVLLAPLPVRDAAQEAREAALEKTREYAFRPTPNPDENKGIGSFRNTIGKELRANNSKSDWEKRNKVKYI